MGKSSNTVRRASYYCSNSLCPLFNSDLGRRMPFLPQVAGFGTVFESLLQISLAQGPAECWRAGLNWPQSPLPRSGLPVIQHVWFVGALAMTCDQRCDPRQSKRLLSFDDNEPALSGSFVAGT
jgi:hypothetical protein